jgi:hypothetical protein
MLEQIAFNPFAWYWLADDGRLYSSVVAAQIPSSDQGYQDWIAQGFQATTWPRDDAGNQTDASLQIVLAEYGIAIDLKAYAFAARDQVEHGSCPIAGVGTITVLQTDDYRQELLRRYEVAVTNDPNFTVTWVTADRVSHPLVKADIDSLYQQGQSFIAGTYATYTQVITDIDSGTITTSDQIDQAFGLAAGKVRNASANVWKAA